MVDGLETTSPKALADAFASEFASVYTHEPAGPQNNYGLSPNAEDMLTDIDVSEGVVHRALLWRIRPPWNPKKFLLFSSKSAVAPLLRPYLDFSGTLWIRQYLNQHHL